MNTTAAATKVKHYVNNEHFLKEMVVFRAAVLELKKQMAKDLECQNTLVNVYLRLQLTWHVSQTLQIIHSKKTWCLMVLKTVYCTLITLIQRNLRIHLHTLPKLFTMHSCEEFKKRKNICTSSIRAWTILSLLPSLKTMAKNM